MYHCPALFCKCSKTVIGEQESEVLLGKEVNKSIEHRSIPVIIGQISINFGRTGIQFIFFTPTHAHRRPKYVK